MPPARSTADHEHGAARTGGAQPPAVAVVSCVSRPAFGG